MSEKRQQPRVEVNHEFESVNEFLREYAMNVSMQGVFIRTAEVLPVGTPVKLKFTGVVEDFETIEGEGEVVRSVMVDESDNPGMGVVFTTLTEPSRRVLAELFLRTPDDDD